MLQYSLEQGKGIQSADIANIAQKFPTKLGEKIMTIADQLRQEGMAQGMEQGIENKANYRKNNLLPV